MLSQTMWAVTTGCQYAVVQLRKWEAALEVDLGKPLTELAKLWDESRFLKFLLWALAVASFLGFVVLAVIGPTQFPSFNEANWAASPWLLLASILFAVLALVKHYQERTIQTVELFPDEGQSFYHGPIKQTDGSITTQISIRFEVFNLTDKSIWLPDVTVIRPRSHAPVRMKHVSLKDQSSNFHGGYELPPHGKTRGSVDLMIQQDLTKQIARKGVAVVIKDQFGHRHTIKLLNIVKS
jgi:hypothetical protein